MNKQRAHFYPFWLLARIMLGFVFIYSGMGKLLTPLAETRALFYEYTLLPASAVPSIAFLFPWVEFFTGSFLVLGYKTRFFTAAMMGFTFCFILLLGSEVLLKGHFPQDCGCFAGSWKLPTAAIFLMDIANFLLLTQFVRITEHPWSLDQWIKSNRGWIRSWELHFGAVGISLAMGLAGFVMGLRHLAPARSPAVLSEEPDTPVSAYRLASARTGAILASGPQMPGPELKQMGPSDAPVEILIYTDFQCPACRGAKPILAGLMARYPGQIKLIFKHDPLAGHLWAKPAHCAAECAHMQGQFWPYHDRLYENQQAWAGGEARDFFIKIAQDLLLDVERFESCLDRSEAEVAVDADKAEARRKGIAATPTFLINGERLVGGRDLQLRGEVIVQRILNKDSKP